MQNENTVTETTALTAEKMFTDQGEVINPADTWVQHDGYIECTQCRRNVPFIFYDGKDHVVNDHVHIECDVMEKLPRSPEHYKKNGALKRRNLPGGWSWNDGKNCYTRRVVHHKSDVVKTDAWREWEEKHNE